LSVLVTGGAGFIGSNLVGELLASGEDVIVLDNFATGSRENLVGLSRKLEVRRGQLPRPAKPRFEPRRHIPSWSSVLLADVQEGPDAGGRGDQRDDRRPGAGKKTGSRVVYASTSSLYSGQTPPHREDMEVLVTDYYTEARFAMERMAELYRKLFGVRAVGMRFFSVYGPREGAKRQYANIVTQFLWEMMAGRAPVIYGDGSQTRDFVYVTDIVRALRLAMGSDYVGALNVGTGKSYSFNDVAEILANRMGLSLEAKHVENPIKNYVAHNPRRYQEGERSPRL